MHIAITGKESSIAALVAGLSSGVNITKIDANHIPQSSLTHFDAVIDVDIEAQPSRLVHYAGESGPLYFLGFCFTRLEELCLRHGVAPHTGFIGMCNFPGMLNRKILELCDPFGADRALASEVVRNMGFDHPEWVHSRVGFVSPRIICMIINEAYYTVQEGTAGRDDVDQAMKLGTNYPMGPFEWCREAGIKSVYRLLDAMYEDTREERYKICPLLKTEYLRTAQEAD
jgi:3-hydroxybutyryl-CoA dehydrogenase